MYKETIPGLGPPMSRKSPMMWPGGKYYLRGQIMRYFPRPLPEMVSPFLGGGHIELWAAANGTRVYAGDIYYPLYCFWRELLDDPGGFADHLTEICGGFPLTEAAAKRAINLWHEIKWDSKDDYTFPSDRDLAAALYLSCKLGYGGFVGRRTPQIVHNFGRNLGYRVNQKSTDRIRQFHAPNLSVQHADYYRMLLDYPEMFVYCDPPYNIPTGLYGQTGEVHKEFNHNLFALAILDRPGPWAVSYNDCDWTREVFASEEIKTVTGRYGIGIEGVKPTDELLILRRR